MLHAVNERTLRIMTEPSDGPLFNESRGAPFCYQTHDALDRIRECFSGQQRVVALGLYLTFTELANRKGGYMARKGFHATRKEIAAHAGVGVTTFDRYVKALEEAGLLSVIRTSVGPVNLPNRWELIDVTPLAPQNALPPDAEPPGSANDAPRARSSSEEERTRKEEPPVAPLSSTDVAVVVPVRPVNRPLTVNRKTVTDVEYHLASEVLGFFCDRTGTRYSSAEWISKIVSRIREHPELGYAAHVHVIIANVADPWWTGPPNPSVIYGNGAQFERSMAKAHADLAGTGGETTMSAADAATYGTEWGPGTPYETPHAARAAAAGLVIGEEAVDAEHWEVDDDGE